MTKYIVLALYILLLFGISWFAARKSSKSGDFLLAGRNVGPWLSAFSYGTSYFSAVIFIGYAGGQGWNFGFNALWVGIGNAVIGCLVAWLLLAKKTRAITQEQNTATMPGFFEKRFGSRGMKIFAAVLIFVFLVPYSASVYTGIGYMFEEVFGLSFLWCMGIMAVLTALYLLAGGYFATAWTNFFQGAIMIVGLALMVYYVVQSPNVGGLATGIARVREATPTGTGGNISVLISTILLTSFGTWALPQMTHKFYAIRQDKNAIRNATIIATGFALFIGCGAYFIGAFGRLFVAGQTDIKTDLIVPQMLASALPEALLGLVVVVLLSASMSTLSALALSGGSALVSDLVRGSFRPKMNTKTEKLLLQVVCFAFIGISMVLAMAKVAAIQTLMNFSWGVLAGAFMGPFVWGVCWKRASKAGGWAGLLGGFLTAATLILIWNFQASKSPLVGCYAMAVSMVLTPVVSLLFPNKPAANSAVAMNQ